MKKFLFGMIGMGFLALLIGCGPTAPVVKVDPGTVAGGTAAIEPQATAEPATSGGELPIGRMDSGHYYMGNLDAPVIIEEFSDFQCPYCAQFISNAFPSIKQQAVESGQALLVFYDFPLNSIHPQAHAAAVAARCAGEQSPMFFWAMHDKLFATQQQWGNDQANEQFKSYAADMNLDVEAFATCLENVDIAAAVDADVAMGSQRGISGTPTFFLNEQPLVGSVPADAFLQAVNKVAAGESIATAPPTAEINEEDIPPFAMPEPAQLQPSTVASLGDADAPITIVEFSDYQCPFCSRHFAETMPALMVQMVQAGRVRYEFKDFPLDNIHPEARSAAEAARCAGDQDAYWEMHDQLFSSQTQWGGQGANAAVVFAQLAGGIGLDVATFEECLASGRHAEAVQADVDEGFALGISGTPAFYIDGNFVSGAQPYDLFELVVNAIETNTLEDLYRQAYDRQVEAYRQQLAQQQQQAAAPQAPQGPAAPIEVPTDNWPSIGDPSAPITIIEYTDFQCPFCGRYFAETFPLIEQNYVDQGLVRYVFKDFPLSIHPQAPKAAEAARCAHEQGQFLAMHNMLFSTQGAWSGRNDAPTLFSGYAADLGLDTAQFDTCLNSGQYAAAVQADLQEGSAIGITGTPSFVVNGQLVVGALPYATFDQALQQMLSE